VRKGEKMMDRLKKNGWATEGCISGSSAFFSLRETIEPEKKGGEY